MPRAELEHDPQGEFPANVRAYLFYLVFQISQQRQAALEADLVQLGLNFAKWRTLLFIWRLEACTLTDLSAISGVDRTTLSRARDRLVRDGLVNRAAAPGDRRRIQLSLTGKGQAAFEDSFRVQHRFNLHVMEQIPQDAQREACRHLSAVLEAMIPEPKVARNILTFGRTDGA
jgi:DNA-binding MarR family transcriptional regulator